MNVSELKAGQIYKCKLSKADVLVFETENQKVMGQDGNEIEVPSKKIGKVCVKMDNGDFKYIFVDLHNGQF